MYHTVPNLSTSAEVIVLSFLPPAQKVRASRINEQMFVAGSHIAAWGTSFPLVRNDRRWRLPCADAVHQMYLCSEREDLCRSITAWTQSGAGESASAERTAFFVKDCLKQLEGLCTRSVAVGDRAVSLRLHLMKVYYPTLLWVMMCSNLPFISGIRLSRSGPIGELSDGVDAVDPCVSLWDLCFTMLLTSEVSLDESILLWTMTSFHVFRIAQQYVGFLLLRMHNFDAPLLTLLKFLRKGGAQSNAASTRRKWMASYLLREALVTLSCIEDGLEHGTHTVDMSEDKIASAISSLRATVGGLVGATQSMLSTVTSC